MPILSILSSRFVRWQLNQISCMSKILWGPESKFRPRDSESARMVPAPRSTLRSLACAANLEFSMGGQRSAPMNKPWEEQTHPAANTNSAKAKTGMAGLDSVKEM